MGNSVRATYTRKITNKLGDGFEHLELGGEIEKDLGPLDIDADDLAAQWAELNDQLVEAVEGKFLSAGEALGSLPEQPKAQRPQREDSQVEEEDDSPYETSNDPMAKWVNKTVKQETARIQERVQRPVGKTMPGERFSRPPQQSSGQREPEIGLEQIVEGQAEAYDRVKVFWDNSTTKMGRSTNKKKYGMLRVGKRGEIPGDYVTAKSFDPEVVPQIEQVFEEKPEFVDIYGYFEPRNNNPEVFDFVLQGISAS